MWSIETIRFNDRRLRVEYVRVAIVVRWEPVNATFEYALDVTVVVEEGVTGEVEHLRRESRDGALSDSVSLNKRWANTVAEEKEVVTNCT